MNWDSLGLDGVGMLAYAPPEKRTDSRFGKIHFVRHNNLRISVIISLRPQYRLFNSVRMTISLASAISPDLSYSSSQEQENQTSMSENPILIKPPNKDEKQKSVLSSITYNPK